MKRIFFGLIVSGLLLLGGAPPARAAHDFTITQFEAEYRLGRDGEQRSTLEATWRITADFASRPHHGIAPIFVKDYEGRSTNFQLVSVTDEDGTPQEYHWRNGNELRIGKKDVQITGLKTYIIKYTQRDVTRYYQNTDRDEFYWDVIGVDWSVPIAQARVTVELDDSLVQRRQGEAFCYYGAKGSPERCSLQDGGALVSATLDNLGRKKGVTVALGFAPGTFMPYQKTLMEQLLEVWLWVQLPATILAFGAVIWLLGRHRRLTGRSAELEPIVPEYIPPSQASVSMSGYLLQQYDRCKGSPMAAQLIDLAVRHYLKLYETKQASRFSSARYEIEIIKELGDLRIEEQEIIKDMFGGALPQVGERLDIKRLKNSTAYARRVSDDARKLQDLAREEYGLCERNQTHRRTMRRWSLWLCLVALLSLSPFMLVAALVVLLLSSSWSLTDEGLKLRRYLAGLKLYIGLAETERLAILQSPEGAQKVKVDTHDNRQLVTLYERVLPYAVLFGQEKGWTAQLGQYYQQAQTQPDWYDGQAGFSAASFATGISSLSSMASSVSSESSSTGGSSGGGFSGGGGGGGGGGGW